MDAVGAAMELPAGERDACLAATLADDAGLLGEARALLAEAAATSVADVTARVEAMVDRVSESSLPESRLPERIGPYRIVRLLGRGGMGVVYLGRQNEPLRRDVAVKVIRAGLVDRDTLARFASERYALARMEHPAIATVYDAGVTDDGLPYFAMEVVEGLPITEHCDREQHDLSARLALFGLVCEAVQHAHQRGVIHRDLKPSNLIVTTVDDRTVPKVIDFGIAKAVEGVLAGDGAHTRAGAFVGTVGYMSPEQLREDAGVDVRSDVYALGVILYELVAGRHPFDEATLRSVGPFEARRIVLETEPPRPSRSLTASGDSGPKARARGTSERRLRRHLADDLDWIVMRAMEKDPARRYQSARELGTDVGRYLRHEPVSAGPPGVWYRARKFVRRHRVGVAAGALVALASVSGSAVAATGLVRATAEARRSAAIGGFLTELLASVRPDEQGRAVTVREILDDARKRLEEGEFADDPETEASLALVLGHSFESLGRYTEAHTLIARSLELRRDLFDGDDRRVYDALYRLGTVMWKEGALEDALVVREELAEISARTMGTSSPEHAESLSNLGNTRADMGDLNRAAEYLERAVEAARTHTGEDAELNLARYVNNLGTVYFDQEAFGRAAEMFEESLVIRGRILGEKSDVYDITRVNLGHARVNLGEPAEA